MSKIPSVLFAGGKQLPIIGYGNGTAQYAKDSSHILEQALSAGFPLIDTAEMYSNSQYVGETLKKHSNGSSAKVIAKLGKLADIRKAALEQQRLLGRKQLDVLLLHLPPRGQKDLPSNVAAWKEMEKLKDEGVAESIGVSNWLAKDIEEVNASKPKHPIVFNQIEHHPLLAGSKLQTDLLDLQRRDGIVSMIYSSLTPITQLGGERTSLHEALDTIAAKEKDWSPATVLFKWASQTAAHGTAKSADDVSQDAIIITTGNKPERFPGYLGLFNSRRLTDEEIEQVTAAGKQQKVKKVYMADYYK